MTTEGNRTHLFISYAIEDLMLAKWLARKLAALGYAVWFDRMKLLGGEPWPRTIDEAIKHRTFRMLALMSRHSISKPNPSKERTLALDIARKRKIPDFLITLKLDNAELDWQTSDITYIDFNRGWSNGLRSLIRKLEDIDAPRVLTDSASLAAATFPRGEELIESREETLFANVVRVRVPTDLTVFSPSERLSPEDITALQAKWPYYRINDGALVSFFPPPPPWNERILSTREQYLWQECELLRNVRARDIGASLIIKSLAIRLLRAGCLRHPKRPTVFYLPESFTEDGKLHFIDFNEKRTWLKIRGKITFWKPGDIREVNYHHFAFDLRLARGLDRFFYVQLRPSLFFFTDAGEAIVDRTVGSRRRRLTKMWWNPKWLRRLMAAEQLLTALEPESKNDVLLERGLVALEAQVRINETRLGPSLDEEESTEPAEIDLVLDEEQKGPRQEDEEDE